MDSEEWIATKETSRTSRSSISRNDRKTDPRISSEAVKQLRALEENSTTETGRVLKTIVVDYDEGVAPDAVTHTVITAIAEEYGMDHSEAADHLLETSRLELEKRHSGAFSIIIVALPNDTVFIDRIPIQTQEAEDTSAVHRSRDFVTHYGEVSAWSQLEGERVPIQYDEEHSKWMIRDPSTQQAAGHDSTAFPRYLYTTLSLLSVACLLIYAVFAALSLSSSPIFGTLSPRSFVLAVWTALAIGFLVDALRTGITLMEKQGVSP